MSLLRLLAECADELKLHLTVAHFHHGHRGEVADRDANFVETLGKSLGFPVVIGRWSPVRTSHFEADARRARYAWLLERARRLLVDHPRVLIATAHTLDDHAETLVHRIARGTGPRGLRGIPRVRRLEAGILLVRPLRDTSRTQLRALLKELEQPWREDATNRHLNQTRARIRHQVLPYLAKTLNPRFCDALLRLADLVDQEHRQVEHRAARIARDLVQESSDDRLRISAHGLRLHKGIHLVEILRAAWRMAGWPERTMSAQRWQRLAKLSASQVGSIQLSGGVFASVHADTLELRRSRASESNDRIEPVKLLVGSTVKLGELTLSAELAPPSGPTPTCRSAHVEQLDWERIVPFGAQEDPFLIVRPAHSGECFDPLGMSGHTQRLADFLRSRRVPRPLRARTLVVADQTGIVWVVGHRIAERVRLTEQTRRCLLLRIE